jgi:hypothetical protein
VSDARGIEAPNGFGDPRRRAERTIPLRGLATIHHVASAEGDGRDVERFLVGLVDPRKQEVTVPQARWKWRPGLGRRRGNLVIGPP